MSCPCGCGRKPPIGERRRWATPACFIKGHEPGNHPQGRGGFTALRLDAAGQEVWLR